jgi:hypothetical protein
MPTPEPFDSETLESVRATRMGISLDWWSVIIAIALALLLRANILPAVPWESTSAPPAKIAAPANSQDTHK